MLISFCYYRHHVCQCMIKLQRQLTNKKADKIDFFKAGEEGIEPPLTVLETAALPLYYSPMKLYQLNH